jgi:hypothetical protein
VTKPNGKRYVYYRCTMYNKPGHPRVRLTEKQMDEQLVSIFARVPQPKTVREWFARLLRDLARHDQVESRQRTEELQNQMAQLRKQQDHLLNLRLLEEINDETFHAKRAELRDRVAKLTVQLEGADRSRDERADQALAVFELSQHLAENGLRPTCRKSACCWASCF